MFTTRTASLARAAAWGRALFDRTLGVVPLRCEMSDKDFFGSSEEKTTGRKPRRQNRYRSSHHDIQFWAFLKRVVVGIIQLFRCRCSCNCCSSKISFQSHTSKSHQVQESWSYQSATSIFTTNFTTAGAKNGMDTDTDISHWGLCPFWD